MKKLLLFLLLCFPLMAGDISKENKPPTVKVLLAKLSKQALVEVKGRFHVYNPKNDELIESHTRSLRSKMTTKEKGLHWGELYSDLFELRIVPNDKNTRILINGIQYRGCVEIYSIGGTLNIVNEVDTENYLKSTLGAKIEETLSKETLDAIVITERTHITYTIQKDAFASWQVEASKVGYLGESAARQNKGVQEAVERTRDLILSYRKKPFATTWGMNSAGKSVSYPSIFRRGGQAPRGVAHLPSITLREKTKWKSTLPQKTLASLTGLTNIKEVDLFRAEKSDKVYAVRFIGEEECKDIDFFTLQKALGEKLLPSNDFTVTLKGKKATITGFGKGLGTGLCATSAEIMASGKSTSEQILKYHFPETNLLNMRQESGRASITSHIWR